MSEKQVNGEAPSSKTLTHITNYPLSSDIIAAAQSNPYAAKTIGLINAFYMQIFAMMLPFFRIPLSILAPYIEKADALGDIALSKADERFPAIKQTDLDTVKSQAMNTANMSLQMAGMGKEYVMNIYGEQYQKMGANGLPAHAKAIVTTEIRVMAEAVIKTCDYLGAKKEELQPEIDKLKQMGEEKLGQAKEMMGQAKDQAKDTGAEVKGQAEEKTDQVVNGQ